MIYNSPGKNSVIFISNTNSMIGKRTDNANADYRRFFGGNYSRDLNEKIERPKIADI